MIDNKILDIFYSKIILEAQNGKIDCFFTINLAFNLTIDNQEISKCNNLNYDGILVPTLKITNKQLFDSLLIKYVKKAQEFYKSSEFDFLDDINIPNIENIYKIKKEYQIKYIICTLFANASFNDFNLPIEFLQDRIAMFDHKLINNNNGEICLGYINSINAEIYISEEVSPIKSETPYRIKSYLKFDDGYILNLPEIYAGSSGNKYHLYGIQKSNKNYDNEDKIYLKKIRKGFIAKLNGAPEHYFLAVMLFLSLCEDKNIEVIPFLVERWNAKKISSYKKVEKNLNSLLNLEKEQDKIQNNMTNILIRYFTKIREVSNGIEFTSIPFETDSNLFINIGPQFESRCIAFNELFNLVKNFKQQKQIKK